VEKIKSDKHIYIYMIYLFIYFDFLLRGVLFARKREKIER
jgi:hypothetical protein